METISYTETRRNFRHTMEMVCNNHAPVIITRQNERSVVMISLEDYNAIEETMYLLHNPNNASRLMKSVENIRNNTNLQERTLVDESDI